MVKMLLNKISSIILKNMYKLKSKYYPNLYTVRIYIVYSMLPVFALSSLSHAQFMSL
jgi:hypothetical protein